MRSPRFIWRTDAPCARLYNRTISLHPVRHGSARLQSSLQRPQLIRTEIMVSLLSFLETRVLGVLIEKERTVPDSYPLTLNALVAGCNQKTSRDPIIDASETEVQ